MHVIANGISVLIIVIGALFALQGLRLLPSQVMYGRPEWVIIGGVMVLAGAALLVFTRSRGQKAPKK